MEPALLPPAPAAQVYLGRTASFVVEMQAAGPDLEPLLVSEWPAKDKEAPS
jgi:hypothetical protein